LAQLPTKKKVFNGDATRTDATARPHEKFLVFSRQKKSFRFEQEREFRIKSLSGDG
jgi:hypothetical protein